MMQHQELDRALSQYFWVIPDDIENVRRHEARSEHDQRERIEGFLVGEPEREAAAYDDSVTEHDRERHEQSEGVKGHTEHREIVPVVVGDHKRVAVHPLVVGR